MDVVSSTDWIIFALVVGGRFILPLFIPFFPLPAIIACLLLDGVDQTIFQVFTTLPLDGYQSYDKALDIYYLSIAYISTFRNWTNLFAFRVSRFLYYYRLVGVALFEATHLRPLLLIFPNTFEYFFIWYEAVKLWWNPRKLSRTAVISAAAFIWIVIKLPQEYWIHIAQNDVTDTIKGLLGGTPESAWGPLIMDNLLLIVLVLFVLGLALWALIRFLRRNTPAPEHKLGWRADDNTTLPTDDQFARARRFINERIFDRDLLEKLALVALLVAVFAQVLPNTRATTAQMVAGAAVIIVLNTVISHWLARRGISWRNALGQFIVVTAANLTIVAAFQIVPGAQDLDDAAVAFFVLLLSVIVTLFDRFTEVHLARFPGDGAKRPPTPAT